MKDKTDIQTGMEVVDSQERGEHLLVTLVLETDGPEFIIRVDKNGRVEQLTPKPQGGTSWTPVIGSLLFK